MAPAPARVLALSWGLIVAVLAFTAAGAAAGGWLAASGYVAASFLGVSAAGWGASIGAYVGGRLFGPKSPTVHNEGPQYTESRLMTSAYGKAVPRVWGTYPVYGNVVWDMPLRKVKRTRTSSVGGKAGGGQKVKNTTYQHFKSAAILLCTGEIIGVRRIWFDDVLKYDVGDAASSEAVIASALNAKAIRVHPGSETQDIDPLIAADKGGDASAMLGYAYMVLEDLEVSDYGGRLPQIKAEVVSVGSGAATLGITAGQVVGTTAVINSSPGFVLGRSGSIWALGTASNTAVRLNFYAGSVQGTYTRASYGYTPAALSFDGEATAPNAGGVFSILHDDGSVDEYTGAPASFGSGASWRPVAWLDRWNGFALGDGSSSLNMYRFALNDSTMQVDETLITLARASHLFQNATGISGRCYVYGYTTFNHEVGYITEGNSKVLLFSGNTYAAAGLVVSRDGYLWMARNGASTDVEKRDADGTLLMSVAIPSGAVGRLFEAPDGYIWAWVSGGVCYGIHPALGTVDFTSVNTGTKFPLGFTEDGRLVFWSSTAGNYSLHELEPIPRITAGAVAASTIVADVLALVGYSGADVALAALTDEVPGYMVASRMPARSALEQVLAFCRAELVESDDQLKAVKRTGTVAQAIDAGDLGAYVEGSSAPEPWTVRRLGEIQQPRELVVEYVDIDSGYEVNAQPARRWTHESEQTELVQTALAMQADDAMRLAEDALDDRWAARMLYSIALPRRYARLEPTDVIQVPGITPALRILGSSSAEGVVALECVSNNDQPIASSASGAPAPAASGEVVQAGPTHLRLLDIPILLDSHDSPGFYVAATGYYGGWEGAELWVSADAGVTYAPIATPILDAAVIGAAASVLATWAGGNVTDEANSIDVLVINGEVPASGACYLGGELIEYGAAALIDVRKYRLSSLRRARNGTEQYLGTHKVGELFVVLDVDTIVRISVDSTELGAERLYKAVSFGQDINAVAPVAFTLAGVGLECYAPVNLRAGRSAAAAWDVLLDWDRRTRVGGAWRNNTDASLGETTQAYEVEIYDATFTTLKRTLTGLTSSSATYTSAQQVADFGSNQSTVYVRVYQLSAIMGRGFVAQASLTT
jgi:hypothetical protein